MALTITEAHLSVLRLLAAGFDCLGMNWAHKRAAMELERAGLISPGWRITNDGRAVLASFDTYTHIVVARSRLMPSLTLFRGPKQECVDYFDKCCGEFLGWHVLPLPRP